MYLSSYSTSTYFHLVTLMAKHKPDRDDELFLQLSKKKSLTPTLKHWQKKTNTPFPICDCAQNTVMILDPSFHKCIYKRVDRKLCSSL